MSAGRSIHALVSAWAQATPDAVAIAAPGRAPLTYGRLLRQIEETARALNEMGLGRTTRVAVVLPNGPEAAVSFLAVAASAPCAPLNPAHRAREFDSQLTELGVSALVAHAGEDSPAIAAAWKRGIPVIRLTPEQESEAGVFTLDGARLGPAAASGFATDGDLALTLSTSGTTATAKVVPLTQANICASAHNVGRALALSAADRCLNVMPLFHVHGLIGALLSSIAAGGTVVCAPGYQASRFLEWLEQSGATWYTAVPTIHQAIVASAARDHERFTRTKLRLIRSCSAPLPLRVALELEATFRIPVIQAYGMTEAAHQIASNPLPPRDRKLGSVGVPFGVDVTVLNSAGESLPPGEPGEIAIRGASVTRGYEGGVEADWLRTGDEGFIDRDGYIFLTGRLKEMINRAGSKISPAEVDEVLLDHPAVAQAVTFAMPHATLGEDVAAAVVLRKDATATPAKIRRFAARFLADFKVPKRVTIVDEIPKGPTGKLQRIGMAERVALAGQESAAPSRPAEPAAPRTPLQKTLAAIWCELLKLDNVDVDADFFDLGGDSLLATELFFRVAATCGVQPSLTRFFEVPTIAAQAQAILESERGPAFPCLVPIQASGHRPPFFCVPAGAEFSYLLNLGRHLAPEQPFYALCPAHMAEAQSEYAPEQAVEEYIREIRAVQPEGPYFVGGWCAGAVVALQLAQALLNLDQDVALLAIIAPSYGHTLGSYWRTMSSLPAGEGLGRILQTLWALGKGLGRATLQQFVSEPVKAPRSIPMSVSEVSQTVHEINHDAMTQVRASYPGRVTLFVAEDANPGSPPAEAATAKFAKLVAGSVDTHVIGCDRDSLFHEPHISELAQQLSQCLDETMAIRPSIADERLSA
ncbi:MAG: acyl-CoA synthetase [Candidatus Rokuibacteriota bacterium]|nr:MAG: acyl-CoA synthetase [Candidatus Rokubacteria bacterium]